MRKALLLILFAASLCAQRPGAGGSGIGGGGGGDTIAQGYPAVTVDAPTAVRNGGAGVDGSISYAVIGNRARMPNSANCVSNTTECPIGRTIISASTTLTSINAASINNTVTMPSAPAGSGIVSFDLWIIAPILAGKLPGVAATGLAPGAVYTDTTGSGQSNDSPLPWGTSDVLYWPNLQGNRALLSVLLPSGTTNTQDNTTLKVITTRTGGSPAVFDFGMQIDSRNESATSDGTGGTIGARVISYNLSQGTTAKVIGVESIAGWSDPADTTNIVTPYNSFLDTDVNQSTAPIYMFHGEQGLDGSSTHTYGVGLEGVGASTGPVSAFYETGMCSTVDSCAGTVRTLDFQDPYPAYMVGPLQIEPANLATWTTRAPAAGSTFMCSDCQVTTVTANVVSNSTCKGSGTTVVPVVVTTGGTFKCAYLP